MEASLSRSLPPKKSSLSAAACVNVYKLLALSFKSASRLNISGFLKNHLSYILLWGNLMTAVRDEKVARANNGIIENSFAMKKREVRESKHKIGSFGKIKIGRYVKHSSDIIALRVKKVMLDIPAKSYSRKANKTSSQNCRTDLDIANSNEMYRKRNPREIKQGAFFRSASASSLSQKKQTRSAPRRSSSLSNKASSNDDSD